MEVEERIRLPELRQKITSAREVVEKIIPRKGTIAFSGMAGTAIAKVIPLELSKFSRETHREFSLNILTGGTTTARFEEDIAPLRIRRRYPVASGRLSRDSANRGELLLTDMWLSEYSRLIRRGVIPREGPIDVAIIESTGVTKNGGIVPSISLDVAPALVESSKRVVIEVNMAKPDLLGLHDVYLPNDREIVPIREVLQRVGEPVIRCPPSKVAAIVVTNGPEESAAAYGITTQKEVAIAEHIVDFLVKEFESGIKFREFYTLQPGAGPVASAIIDKMPFDGVRVWAEALTTKWVSALGHKVKEVSCACLYALAGEEKESEYMYENIDQIKRYVILRPYEITNRAEIISRMNLVSIQQAIEVDIYGNTNISHIAGDIYNGVGGSGDFSRTAHITLVALPSTTANEKISRIVPFCSHVDVPEHDVDVLVTENGWVDLRGLSPRERAELIIKQCMNDKFRDTLWSYYEKAREHGGHEPVDLKEASMLL